jgi:para-nitrobenzyl esterase
VYRGISGNGPDTLQQLRVLPAEAIVDRLNMANTQAQQSTFAGPMIAGRIVMEQFDRAYSEGKNQRVPILAGANSMDIGFAFGKTPDELFSSFGSNAGVARKAYDPLGSGDVVRLRMEIGADALI